MKFIHYGSPVFDPKLFTPAKNRKFPDSKPEYKTGLWASPVDSEYSWKDWCESENFRECANDNAFIFELHPNTRIYTINNIDDLNAIPQVCEKCWVGLDFEALSKDYDVLHLTADGFLKTRLIEQTLSTYSWDCESIVVLNAGVII